MVTAVAVLPALAGAGGALATLGFLAPALGGLAAAVTAMRHPNLDSPRRRTLALAGAFGGIAGGLTGAVVLLSLVGFLPEAVEIPSESSLGLGAAAVGAVAVMAVFLRSAEAFVTDRFRWKRALGFGLLGAVVGAGLWVGSVLVDIAQREAAGLDTTNQALALFGAYLPAIFVGAVTAVAAGASSRPDEAD